MPASSGTLLRPQTSGDPLLDSIQVLHRTTGALAEIRQRQLATQLEVAEVRGIAETATATATAALRTAGNIHGYMTVLGYCNVTGREVSEREAISYGRQLAILCATSCTSASEIQQSFRGDLALLLGQPRP